MTWQEKTCPITYNSQDVKTQRKQYKKYKKNTNQLQKGNTSDLSSVILKHI